MIARKIFAAAACSFIAGVLILFAPALASAQEAPSAQITTVSTEEWPAVQTAITVLDPSGRPVTGLTVEDFSAAIGDTGLPVTAVKPASSPGIGIAVVMTFDTSGSMAGAPLQAARDAAKSLLPQLGPEDRAAVVSFGSSVTVVQGFTADHAKLGAAIDSLTAVGNTALYAAVRDSIELADSAPLPRRSVILLSDGVDFGGVSDVSAATTYELAEASDAIIFTIGLGSGIDESYLRELAARGKGQYLAAPTPAQLSGAYGSAADVLRNQYIVALDASGVDAAVAAGKPLVVTVNVGGESVSATTEIDVPAPASQAPTPTVSPAPATMGPDAVDEGSSGGFPVLIAAPAGLALLGVLAGGGVLLVRSRRRRRRKREAIEVMSFRQPDAPHGGPEITRAVEPETALAWLQLPGGERVPLGQTPVTIGFTADCTVQLPDGAPGAMERARVWWRDGSFMLHNLSRVGNITVGGNPVTWVVLEDGDEIAIGGSRIVFLASVSGDSDSPGGTG